MEHVGSSQASETIGTRSPAAAAGAWGGRTIKQSARANVASIELSWIGAIATRPLAVEARR